MKTALLVIDYINGIAHGTCKTYVKKHPIIERTNKLISACRAKNIPVYFVRLVFDKNYSDAPKHSNMFHYLKLNGLFQLGSKDSEFVPSLDYRKEDIVINKTATSPFHSKDLKKILESNKIEKLIFSGLSTDNAINIGTREAHDAGFYTVIAEDACGASTEEFHHWAIELLRKIANEIDSVESILKKF